jgi:cell division protein FtsB
MELEKALAKTEADVDATLKAANSVVSSLKRFRGVIKTGSLRELRKTIESAEQAVAALKQQFSNTKDGWNFDTEDYIASKAFPDEILEMSKSLGVKIFEQDERLYCYPFLIRIIPNELAVQIDKTKDKRLRPSTLVSHLKALQNKPVRFRPEMFLESLFSAYETLIRSRGKDQVGRGIVIPLLDIYRLLTLLPGQAKEYSRQEFARDVYLLDQSGVTKTKKDFVIRLPASTGTRSTTGTIRVITREGQDKPYYGISFTKD